MSNKSSKKSSKKSKQTDTEDDIFDDPEYDSEIDQIQSDVNYKIKSVQSPCLSQLHKFLSDAKMINASGDPTTNIIDRHSCKCYNIPDNKIPKYFKLMEECRKEKIRMMMTERQGHYSGIMLDFDIYQDNSENQISDEIFYTLCQKIIELLKAEIINYTNVAKESTLIGITRRPKITYDEKHKCYKDGFHLLIPGIQVTRGVKKFIIQRIIELEMLDQVLLGIKPANIKINSDTKYQRKHFLDVNSAHVPVFFIGSSTKKGHVPYILTHIYSIVINFEMNSIMITKEDNLLKNPDINICYEFSINYECNAGIIKKNRREPSDKYISVENAQKEVEDLLGHKINPIKVIKFESGRGELLWEKNCLALGLASSFAEPLEATSIHTTIVQLVTFCFEFMSKTWEETYNEISQKRYNLRMQKMYDDIRDFLVIHYQGGRSDSDFWRHISSGKTLTPFAKEILEKSKNKPPGFLQYDRYFGCAGPSLWSWILAGTNNLTRDTAKKELELYGIIV
jgi:hypothetical protein